jgi:hypothetical protein
MTPQHSSGNASSACLQMAFEPSCESTNEGRVFMFAHLIFSH